MTCTALRLSVVFLAVSLLGHALGEEPPAEQRPNPFVGPVPVPALTMGRDVRADGSIPDAAATSVFMLHDPIYIGSVDDVADGSTLRLLVLDRDSRQTVWSERTSAAGDERPHFEIEPGELPAGNYLARLIADDETVGERGFEIRRGRAD